MTKHAPIIVTGATGFLGSRLMRRLQALPRPVHAFGRDTPLDLFQKLPGAILVHCAGVYGRNGESPEEISSINYDFPIRLVEAGLRSGMKGVLNVGTALPKETSEYSRTKAKFRDWLRARADTQGLVVGDVSLQYFYGPGEPEDRFFSRLVHQCLRKDARIELTSGLQKRDFIYIDDAVEGCIKVLEWIERGKEPYREFPLGSGVAVEIRELARTIQSAAQALETRLEFGKIPARPHEPELCVADLRPMRELGFEPKVGLHEGLHRTLEHARNEGNLR